MLTTAIRKALERLGAQVIAAKWSFTGPPVLKMENGSTLEFKARYEQVPYVPMTGPRDDLTPPKIELPSRFSLQDKVRGIFVEYVNAQDDGRRAKETCIKVIGLFGVRCVSDLSEQDCVAIINGYRRHQKDLKL